MQLYHLIHTTLCQYTVIMHVSLLTQPGQSVGINFNS